MKQDILSKLKPHIILILLVLVCTGADAQVIRPYNLLYSENLKGGCTLFGNTMMHIVDNNAVNLVKMNETGNPANTAGGIGFSQYGNDNANMQFADVDGTLPPTSAVFAPGSTWKYLDNNTRPADWETSSFDDAAWAQGAGELGFGDGDEATVINGGPASSRYMTTYFRKTVNIPAGLYRDFTFNLIYDDGAMVYINGVEVARINMPAGVITHNTPALSAVENVAVAIPLPASAFANGANTIAVEVHQRSNKSDDLSFELSLVGTNINTVNSSTADLLLPAGTNTIKFARLYWGGRIDNSVVTASPDTIRRVKIRKGTSGPYVTILAPVTNTDQSAATSLSINYQSFIDITAFVNSNGAGTYTVADIPATTGATASGGNYAGWSIVVAYANNTQPFNSVRIYDGFLNVFNGGAVVSQSVTLTGLNVPNTPLALPDAVMTSMIWEGDANLGATASNPAGDFLKINGTPFTNTVNPITNMWNGSISKNGSYVTTKNPDYTNQMGIDIDEIEVGAGYGIVPNATSVTIEFGTEADRYFPSLFTFCIRMKEPTINLDKLVADANGNSIVDSGETLTYTLSGTNTGPGTAFNCVVTDTLPANVTYIPGTLEVVNCPGITPGFKTDAADGDIAQQGVNGSRTYISFFLGTNATGTAGGQLQAGESYTLRFKVQAAAIPGSVINTARIRANAASGEPFVDDGTAIITPLGGAIPVKLSSFTATLLNNRTGVLQWTTEQETSFSHFELERSSDGQHFNYRTRVNGTGNSTIEKRYAVQDILDEPVKVWYYRLRLVDIDGKISYSSIIPLRVSGNTAMAVYPNPFKERVNILCNSTTEQQLTCRLLNTAGQTVLEKRLTVARGDNLITINDLGYLPGGHYMLRISGNGINQSVPLIKE